MNNNINIDAKKAFQCYVNIEYIKSNVFKIYFFLVKQLKKQQNFIHFLKLFCKVNDLKPSEKL